MNRFFRTRLNCNEVYQLLGEIRKCIVVPLQESYAISFDDN